MPVRKITQLLFSANDEQVAQGLRLISRGLGTDSIHNQRPDDYQQKRDALTERKCEERLFQLAGSDNEVHRELAADAIGAWLGDDSLEILLTLTQDNVTPVRASAVGGLVGWPRSERAYEVLLLAVDDPEWLVRTHAARALVKFPGEDADVALMEVLLDPVSFVRNSAGESLKLRDRAQVLKRLRGLLDHPAPYMFDAALDLMGELGTMEDARFLAGVGRWTNLSQPAQVKRWAREATRRIKHRNAGKRA